MVSFSSFTVREMCSQCRWNVRSKYNDDDWVCEERNATVPRTLLIVRNNMGSWIPITQTCCIAVDCRAGFMGEWQWQRIVVKTVQQQWLVWISLDTQDVWRNAVSEPAHLVAHQRTQHSIVVRPTAVRAISTDIICQTIVQHCRASDLELTATCCVKTETLYFKIKT